MTRLKKAFLVFGLLLLWLGVGFWVFQSFGPTPEENYQEWLVVRRGGVIPSSKLEQWAQRFGIHYFEEARQRTDRRRTEELLADESYAVPVASFLDSGRRAGGWRVGPDPLSTWSPIKEALLCMIRRGDGEGLEGVLSRTDAAGFATWDRTIARSAYQNRALDELALIVTEWRAFEQEHELGTSHAETLHQISELYALSPADFARALSATSDPSMKSLLDLVMQDLGISRGNVYQSLLTQWKADQFPESEWELAGQVVRDLSLGYVGSEIFTWLALGQETVKWREHHRAEIGVLLDEYQQSDPSFAKQCASGLVNTMVSRSAELEADWELVADILLSKLNSESDLKAWINDQAGPDFILLCSRMNAEDLLNLAVPAWNDMIPNRMTWISEVLRHEHFRAASLLIEGVKEERLSIEWGTEEEAKSGSLNDYLALYEKLASHSDHLQSNAFIRLLLMDTALRDGEGHPDEAAAREALVKAIKGLGEVEAVNEDLLRQSVSILLRLDDELLEIGQVSIEKWRRGREMGEVIAQVVRDELPRGGMEERLWSDYIKRHDPSPEELPKLADRFAEWFQNSWEGNPRNGAVPRLQKMLGITPWKVPESGDLEFAAWVLKKMNRQSLWNQSVEWMVDQIEELRVRLPEVDETIIQQKIYWELVTDLAERSPSDGICWFMTVLNEDWPESLLWPSSFKHMNRDRYRWTDRDILPLIEQHLTSHPLRRWIALSLFHGEKRPRDDSPEALARVLESVQEPWLAELMKEYFEAIVDIDAFEHDMAKASRSARRYFLTSPVFPSVEHRSGVKHPSGRYYKDAERLEYYTWEAEERVALMEEGKSLAGIELGSFFRSLFEFADTVPDSPRLQLVAKRLQNISDEEGRFMREDELKWVRSNSLLYAKGLPVSERLLLNEGREVIERVWMLALLGEYAAARKLMAREPDQLHYQLVRAVPFHEVFSQGFPPELFKFREEFAEGDEFGIYVSVYLSDLRKLFTPSGWRREAFHSLKHSKPDYIEYEKKIEELILPFESTLFTSAELEQKTAIILGGLIGGAALMPQKLVSMRESPLNDEVRKLVPFYDFDAQLRNEEAREIKRRLTELAKLGSSGNADISYALDILQYHLLRRAFFNMEITEEQREVIDELCFAMVPFHEIEEIREAASNLQHRPRRFARLLPLSFALELIDRMPETAGDWAWSDFEGMDFDRYLSRNELGLRFLPAVAAVIAARGEDWDEETRWSFIQLFETPLPGESEVTQVGVFERFLESDFVKEKEIEERVPEFVLQYPGKGWNYLAMWKLYMRLNDPEKAELAFFGAELFFGEDPILDRYLIYYGKQSETE